MKIFYLFSLLLSCVASAQSKTTAVVEYSFFGNTELPTSYYATLYINKDISLFHEKINGAVRGELKTDDGRVYESFTTSTKPRFLEPYFKIDRSKHEIFFFEVIGANTYLVQDNYQNLEWLITDENKIINNFSCNKAIANFRGRQWVAWFTTEIPLSFGPWKLHGLPGLIIEAYDATNRYTWRAVKIKFEKSDLFNRDFGSLIKTKNTKPIAYQQFLLNSKEYDNNVDAEMMKNTPNLRDIPVPNNGLETNYEWEK